MARAKYTVTAPDLAYVTDWISRQLRLSRIELRCDVTYRTALNRFEEALNDANTKAGRAKSVNAWCEEFLTSRNWDLLKTSVRKRRQRRQSIGQIESITISKKAHELLKKLAKRDNVTFSVVLETHLAKALSPRSAR